jgi:phenylpropionate dioxygenase-like ring-hydroxylating dioxygenase large terminal subunit
MDRDIGAPIAASPTYTDLLDADSRPVPGFLREESPPPDGTDTVSTDRYTSAAWADLELDRMWLKVWQAACREEEIPNPGDVFVYDIVDRSVLVTRGPDGAIRAFANSCLHRGRKLRTESGHADSFRCTFHGWTWGTDGELKSLPCREDFARLGERDLKLPELQVAVWAGFVFVNFDREAKPLADYLGPAAAHFARWNYADRYKAVHVARRLPCNWKVAQEAFMESYHVIATHPQILPIIADSSSRYDTYGDHVNRNLAAFGASSPHLAGKPPSDADIVNGMLRLWGRTEPAKAEHAPPRKALGEMARRAFGMSYEGDFAIATDAELLDAMVYNIFPNLAPWGGFAPNVVYRWKPDGRNPDSCIMEVMILKPAPKGKPRPKPAALRMLGDDQPWSEAKDLPILGAVIDQDMENLPFVQQGLKASATRKVEFGGYQEGRIRHFHRTLGKYVMGD